MHNPQGRRLDATTKGSTQQGSDHTSQNIGLRPFDGGAASIYSIIGKATRHPCGIILAPGREAIN